METIALSVKHDVRGLKAFVHVAPSDILNASQLVSCKNLYNS